MQIESSLIIRFLSPVLPSNYAKVPQNDKKKRETSWWTLDEQRGWVTAEDKRQIRITPGGVRTRSRILNDCVYTRLGPFPWSMTRMTLITVQWWQRFLENWTHPTAESICISRSRLSLIKQELFFCYCLDTSDSRVKNYLIQL